MQKLNLKWSKNNEKIRKTNKSNEYFKIVSFGLPAAKTCPGALACKSICYALQGNYCRFNVIKTREFNYKKSIRKDFYKTLERDVDILSKKYNCIRIHDSGDFYNKKYLNNWLKVAKKFPNIKFYSYSKSLNIVPSVLPENFVIIQSFGGKYDNLINIKKPFSRIFSSRNKRIKNKYLDGNKTDLFAIEGRTKIGLVAHSIKKLTNAQKKYFS